MHALDSRDRRYESISSGVLASEPHRAGRENGRDCPSKSETAPMHNADHKTVLELRPNLLGNPNFAGQQNGDHLESIGPVDLWPFAAWIQSASFRE